MTRGFQRSSEKESKTASSRPLHVHHQKVEAGLNPRFGQELLQRELPYRDALSFVEPLRPIDLLVDRDLILSDGRQPLPEVQVDLETLSRPRTARPCTALAAWRRAQAWAYRGNRLYVESGPPKIREEVFKSSR